MKISKNRFIYFLDSQYGGPGRLADAGLSGKKLWKGFSKACQLFCIKRQDWLLAQCFYESAKFKYREENLNYSWKRLLKVFPKYFKNEKEAREYSGQPENIAIKVYGHRMGNKGFNDGWKFRGRGFIQLTGRYNYTKLRDATKIDFVKNPDLLLEDKNIFFAAGFFWVQKKIDKAEDFKQCTRIINGGTRTYKPRLALLKELQK